MRTKTIKKQAVLKPVVRFYLSEEVRQEVNGKVSAMGLYPDNVVVLQLPDDIPEPTETNPIAVKSLAFLFNISQLSETTTVSIDIDTSGKVKPLLAPRECPAPGPGRSTNMIGVMEPCLVTSFGERSLIVTVGKTTHRFEFEIRRTSAPLTGAAPEAMSKPPAAKRTRLVVRKKDRVS